MNKSELWEPDVSASRLFNITIKPPGETSSSCFSSSCYPKFTPWYVNAFIRITSIKMIELILNLCSKFVLFLLRLALLWSSVLVRVLVVTVGGEAIRLSCLGVRSVDSWLLHAAELRLTSVRGHWGSCWCGQDVRIRSVIRETQQVRNEHQNMKGIRLYNVNLVTYLDG